jgi:histidine decarboxylase
MRKEVERTPFGEAPLAPEDQREFERMLEYIREQARTFVGYPCRGYFDYSPLFDFLYYPVNNVGDPFAPCTYRVHTREIERKVLAWFAELNHIPEGDYWGYVTNGGTEGNIYGLFLARELYPSGIVYYSEDTHYSVSKNLRVLNMKHIMIKSLASGEIDYEDLYETLRIHRDIPPIVFANAGTTMTEAKDDILRIRKMLRDLAIHESYIHVDAALCGMTLPFIDGAPLYDFRAGIDSISISGHKFIGCPFPCGIVLAKKKFVERIARSIEYVGTLDTTLTGSRNGVAALFLWYAICRTGMEGYQAQVADCLEKAGYAIRRLREIGVEAWRNPHSITVVFERPPEAVLRKWQIAVQHDRAHIITMQTISREQIDALIADIVAEREREAGSLR